MLDSLGVKVACMWDGHSRPLPNRRLKNSGAYFFVIPSEARNLLFVASTSVPDRCPADRSERSAKHDDRKGHDFRACGKSLWFALL